MDDHEYSPLTRPRKTGGEETSEERRREEWSRAETDGMEAEMDRSHWLEEEKMRRGVWRLS